MCVCVCVCVCLYGTFSLAFPTPGTLLFSCSVIPTRAASIDPAQQPDSMPIVETIKTFSGFARKKKIQ